ncbi:hybrid sensor histidine kinase/response regulator, partial [Piscinibacter sp.]|uniref:hybrid sensor histidine kinase/response regulator n=1 Tax=Piscinibacter sp. TaxID=1903157 RepID=UPI002F40C410
RWETRMQEVFRLRIVTERVSQERKEALALAQLHSTAKDRFLAVVSHELRTPLHGILGLTRLARGEVPRADGALHYHLELIEEAGEHLKRMVNDLLDISSIEAGRLELKLAPLDLAREIMLLRETYHARAMEAGIGFTTLTRGTVDSWVIGDDVRVAQVLHNLLGNAFKFTPLGGEVGLTVRREPGSAMVEFEIRDSGHGIAAGETERVFETFVQGSARAGSRPEGVGLGLSIARQLARAMGGDVRCISEAGKGSTFVFSARLPLADVDWPKEEPESTRLEASRRQSSGRTVAIAEDDALSALVSASTVRRLGFDIEEFGDGQALVSRLTRSGVRPDLVLMDWDMPRLNGKQATLAIREYERAHELPQLPIIGLSANASPGYAAEARRAGMDEFVAKPCPPGELAKLIEAFIGRPEPAPPLTPMPIEASPVRRV